MSTVNRLQCIGKLGEGTYGVVYKARELATGQIVAYKRIIVGSEDDGAPSTAIREIALLKVLKHNNIVRLYDVLFEPPKLTLIFEYCEYDLRRFMHKHASRVRAQVKEILKQVLLGLRYMHQRSVVHRDLKPDNIFVRVDGISGSEGSEMPVSSRETEVVNTRGHWDDSDGAANCPKNADPTENPNARIASEDHGADGTVPSGSTTPTSQLVIKLGDYGMARIESIPVKKYSHDVASLWYRSPDALLGSAMYGFAVDLWSVGCIFAEMVTGAPLIRGNTDVDQLLKTFKLLGTPTPETWPSMKNCPKAVQLLKAAAELARGEPAENGKKTKNSRGVQKQHERNLPNVQKTATGTSHLSAVMRVGIDGESGCVADPRDELYHFPPELCFPSAFDEYVKASGFQGRVGVEGTDFLRRLIRYEPSQRMSVQEALSHPFVSNTVALMQRPLDVMASMLRQSLREHSVHP
ncbi:cell division control protein 2 homolog 4,putative [Trypanosoma brucei gambiense DAL972]|uniref:cyclin-dependent kinase n=3 Tax=Trypanosoma brucei TaxID=5691 RepID=C9ZW07_TRYB9|nr:cell division control protein 2 homolog 4,putative [Trypanosoma brucei gambiense DAL972]RHW72885.1 cell division control protein 2 like protein 4 [Trypanosoma brucei equiperdum]CAC88354.1 CRK4 protein [Trypanosoma brucei]CBH13595.1 cell division control protein 2 homolog 4,putative [Trypanosoma brucei gambiense DAL972]|eukprot:XP_011775872.1 cell division control protein 2 homolog 4,putative [Trypanosoma brucei gambiense DAL972]